MKIVKGKLKEITKKEYEDIISISRIMTCMREGEDLLVQYLGLENNTINRNIAFNILNAVLNNYKYFKIIK